MVLKLPGHLAKNETGKDSISQAQVPFKERTFCIVGDEMKAKMEALGLDEEGFAEIFSSENEIVEYLEIVGKHFEQLKIIKDYFSEKNAKMLYNPGNKRDVKRMTQEIKDETKNNLGDLLTHHKSLRILFSKYPNTSGELVVDSLKNGYFNDLMSLAWCGRDGEKYQFNPMLVKDFVHKNRNNKSTVNGKNAFELLCDAYDNLWEHFQNINLFNGLLKLCVAGDFNSTSLYYNLSRYNEQQIECFAEDYELLIKLGIIAGKNNSKFFDSPYIMGKTTKLIQKNGKINESIFLGIEKLGPDFIYILNNNSGFIQETLKRFPERFIEFCENLKKLADYSQTNDTFYNRCLTGITQFVVDYPDKWNYLLKIGEIFEKNTPGVLSIGRSFVLELIKYFPENYEEILVEVRDVGEHIHGGNEGNLLTWGLKFLAQFLEEGKEVLFKKLYELKRLNDEKLNKSHNTGNIFFIDGLSFIGYYMFWFPDRFKEVGEKMAKIINKHSENRNKNDENFLRQFIPGMNNYIDANIIDQDPKLLDELLNFLENVGGSKDALRVIKSLGEITFDLPDDDEIHDYKALSLKNKLNKNAISYTLAYLLKHKKSKIIPFIGNLSLIKDLNLGININSVLLGGVSLEYKSSEELQKLFAGDNVQDTKIWKYFLKIGGQNSEDIKRWIGQIKQAKKIDKAKAMPYLIKIQNVFAESVLEYFKKVIHKKIHLKFTREFKLSKDFDDSLLNENLFEFYKMYSSTTINKQQAFELIQRYLKGEVYTGNGDILQTYPYNREENRLFLDETLKDKSHIWLSRNERTYDINEENNGEEKVDNIPERIAHHLKVANEKLKLLEIKDEKGDYMTFETHGDLRKYFNLTLKKEIEKYDTNLFHDLEFQIQEIERLLKSNNEQRKKVSKIKIYHELEPLKIAMMGNWVEGSCLSFYHPVKNFYSAITNALELNKGVFYIEDEHGNVIARVLVGIDNNGYLEIHPMYFKGNIGINIKELFYFQYMSELTSKLGVTKHGDRDKVKLLFCEKWYSGD